MKNDNISFAGEVYISFLNIQIFVEEYSKLERLDIKSQLIQREGHCVLNYRDELYFLGGWSPESKYGSQWPWISDKA